MNGKTGVAPVYLQRPPEDTSLSEFLVISLTETTAELLECRREGKRLAAVGLRLSTADPYYDPAKVTSNKNR